MPEVTREVLSDATLRLSANGCSFTFEHPRSGVMHVTVAGEDAGQFGTRTLDEVRAAIARDGRVELFIDAHDASATASCVTEAWKQFLTRHRADLARVHVLVGSKFMYLNVAITQHLAGATNLLRIYTDREEFERIRQG